MNRTQTANQPPHHTFVAHLTTQDTKLLTYASWKSPEIREISSDTVIQSRTR
jgi:hypothetical protein